MTRTLLRAVAELTEKFQEMVLMLKKEDTKLTFTEKL